MILLEVACGRRWNSGQPVLPLSAIDSVVIEVVEDGLYRISLASLQQAGLAVDRLNPEDLHLSQAGEAVPYLIQREDLLFYGLASDDRYTAVRTYVLNAGISSRSMATEIVRSGNAKPLFLVRQSLHLEQDNIYVAESFSSEQDDVWFWQTIGQGQKVEMSIELPEISAAPATIRFELYGKTHNPQIDGDHDFDLIVNQVNIATIRWDGQTSHTAQLEIPSGVLVTGENTLTLDNAVAGNSFLDVMALNWLELSYLAPPLAQEDRLWFDSADGIVPLSGFSDKPLILELTDTHNPILLQGWEYQTGQAQLAVTSEMQIAAFGPTALSLPEGLRPFRRNTWRDSTNQADLIIITTDEMIPELEPLVTARQAQGIRVLIAPVADIYDEFGYGAASPSSVSAFITYAYHNWQEPRPKYLLLVGDATSDYRNNLGNAPPIYVPSPMVPVEYSGETVSDSRLVDVDSDGQPELAVGRWPVGNVGDVRRLVKRTLAYERGDASQRALFTVDGTESQFANLAQSIWTAAEIPAEQAVLLKGPTAGEVVSEWNKGAWLATYIGHGSVQQWGKDNLFNLEAVRDLRTDYNPPIVIQLTCLTGLFAHPELTSLSETMLLHQQGPVLLVAATSLSLSTDQEALARPLLRYLQNPQYIRIGDVFQAAKLALNIAQSDALREISDTFVLLGDPSALIIRPDA